MCYSFHRRPAISGLPPPPVERSQLSRALFFDWRYISLSPLVVPAVGYEPQPGQPRRGLNAEKCTRPISSLTSCWSRFYRTLSRFSARALALGVYVRRVFFGTSAAVLSSSAAHSTPDPILRSTSALRVSVITPLVAAPVLKGHKAPRSRPTETAGLASSEANFPHLLLLEVDRALMLAVGSQQPAARNRRDPAGAIWLGRARFRTAVLLLVALAVGWVRSAEPT